MAITGVASVRLSFSIRPKKLTPRLEWIEMFR